ncbi:MAG TPA: LON peptidase substrate-binding domain-containing protein [Solirubrobacteraceae bacterium]|nr:LON peptidase substrate-binding domain-containing protein [Solirubrobacteraceae bacterium]
MSALREEGFPLFPLGIVALPTETVPLHIFEDRYKRMIEECLEHERELGIVWLSEEELKSVGCACEIERVLERGEDGSVDIVVRGTRPFQLIEREDELPYPAGTIEPLRDADEEPDADAAQTARELYSELVEQATDKQLSEDELAGLDAYTMAGTVEFGTDAKQELLELRSENARMRLLALLFRAAIKRLELVDRAQVRALSNGKVRFS